jgi:hypothetical protein
MILENIFQLLFKTGNKYLKISCSKRQKCKIKELKL